MSKSIEELNLGSNAPIHIKSEATVLEAMELMTKQNISSLAIVDVLGILQGNISMADIRFILQHGRYNRLWMTCFSFMSSALSQKSLEANGRVIGFINAFRIDSHFLTLECRAAWNAQWKRCWQPNVIGFGLSTTIRG